MPRRSSRSKIRPWGAARLSTWGGPTIGDGQTRDIIFIRDIAQSSDEAWKTMGSCFLHERLSEGSRIFTFDYDSSYADSIDRIISYDALRINALRLLRALRHWKKQHGRFFEPFIVAHGYGGLMCEQAYLLSLQEHRHGFIRIEGLVLFGTPHFRAGLAQWAILSAKNLKIPCADTPQQQDWSSVRRHLNSVAEMQKEFRALDPGPRIACFFALLSTPKSKLRISPEWAVLPGVKSIPLDSHHFSMTKPESARASEVVQLQDLINGKLSHRLSQETLLRHWIQASQQPHEIAKDPSLNPTAMSPSNEQIGIPGSSLQDMKASASQNDELTTAYPVHEEQSEGTDDRPWGMDQLWYAVLYRESITLEEVFEAERRIVDSEHERMRGNIIDILDYLLASRRDQVTITRKLLSIVTEDKINGADILDLFFVMKGDQITVDEETLKTAISKARDGMAIMEILLSRNRDHIYITEEVIKAAAANLKRGKPLVDLLLKRCPTQIKITEEILKVAAANEDGGKAILEALLLSCGYQIDVTEEVMKAAAANGKSGKAVIDLLLERSRNPIKVTEEILKAAAANEAGGKAVMDSLLLGYGDDIILTEEVVMAAITNLGDGGAIIDLLVGRYGDRVPITDELAKATTKLHGGGTRENASVLLLRAVKDKPAVFASFASTLVDTAEIGHDLLSWAALQQDDDAFRLLLGIDQIKLNVRDRNGHTTLSWAATRGEVQSVKFLLGVEGIDVNSQDHSGGTPLLWAAKEGHEEIVQLLLNKDEVDVNSRDHSGWTPLLWAAKEGHEGVVKLLLNKDEVDVDVEGNQGETPQSQAGRNGYFGITRLLREKRKNAANI